MSDLKCQMAIVKVASRCNINCTYCYMYNKGDMSYLSQPKKMSADTWAALVERVKEHCLEHQLEHFIFVLHGGEPLLAGKEELDEMLTYARQALKPHLKVHFSIQTNALLLDDDWFEILARHKVNIGISIDGIQPIHDAFRIDHKEEGTYERTVAGLRRAQQSPALKAANIRPNILCVLNIDSDPVEAYEHFKSLNTKNLELILPDHNHNDLPRRPEGVEAAYGDWLVRMFDAWFYDQDKDKPYLRFFINIIDLVMGRMLSIDSIGSVNKELIVIETNGGIESVDSLKICGDGFTKSDANVRSHSLNEALQTPLANLFHQSGRKLCGQCNSCLIKNVCGGGHMAHRFSHENGFNNPSVYCLDLLKIITHVQNSVLKVIPEDKRELLEIEPVTFEMAKAELRQTQLHEGSPEELELFALKLD